jgi:hypothetical protein
LHDNLFGKAKSPDNMVLHKRERDPLDAGRVLILRANERFVLLDLYDLHSGTPTLALENVVPNLRADRAEPGGASPQTRRDAVERSIHWALDNLLGHGNIVGIGCWDANSEVTDSWTLNRILAELPLAPTVWLDEDPAFEGGVAASLVMTRLQTPSPARCLIR